MSEEGIGVLAGIRRMRVAASHWLSAMDGTATQQGIRRTAHGIAGHAGSGEHGTLVEPWTPIGEDRAARVLGALLVEPKEAIPADPPNPGVARNPPRHVALAVLAATAVGLFEVSRNVQHQGAPAASLAGPGMPEGAAFARSGHPARTNQGPDMDKRVMASALAGAMLAGSAGAQSTAVQWRVEDGGNGHWYRGSALASGGYSQASALAEARSLRGDLVSFSSQAERDFVAANVLNDQSMWVRDGGTTYGPWTGAYLSASCEWSWTSGEPFIYAPWAWGEPDSGCQLAGNNFGCLMCKSCGNQPSLPSQMGDLGGNFPLAPGLIVEWSEDCNHDGTVDFGQILQGELPDGNSNGILDTCECGGADITGNGIVDGADLGAMLAFWGPVGPVLPEADLNQDGSVSGADLSILLLFWGPCGG